MKGRESRQKYIMVLTDRSSNILTLKRCQTERFCFHHAATAARHGDWAIVLNPEVQVVLENPFQSHVTLKAEALL